MDQGVEQTSPVDKDQRLWATFCHLAAFSGFLIPLGNILGPLIIWLIKKDEMAFVDDQGKEAVNFQLTMLIALLVAGILVFVLIGFFLLAVIGVYELVVIIIAAIKANEGKPYRYPLTIRFIK